MTQTMTCNSGTDQLALAAYTNMRRRFTRQGISIAILSGIVYGLFTTFMTLAMTLGVWKDWGSANSTLSPFVQTYLVGTLGSGILCLWGAFGPWPS
ncbi:MAG: hypothetical protein IJT59_00445 [Desulfovibrionaceae bacterium]|nr:hypothetical protein [Desulfovibrionaceae bacterium]